MRSYLVAQGLVRPAETSGVLPPCWLDMREGIEQPKLTGTDDSLVELREFDYIRKEPYVASQIEEAVVDVTVRARTSPKAKLLMNALRRAFDDQRNIDFGSLHVEWCYLWRGPRRLGSDSYSYDLRATFRVCATRQSLVA